MAAEAPGLIPDAATLRIAMTGVPAARARFARFAALVLLVASLGVVVHHASSALAMDGMMAAVAHTCVAVTAHSDNTPAAPIVVAFFVLGWSLALFAASAPAERSPSLRRARARPPDFLLPLRC